MNDHPDTSGRERAVEGMLREYMRAGKGDDEELVGRIMTALDDIPARRNPVVRLWPAWAAIFVIGSGALFSFFMGRAPQPPLAVVRSGELEIQRDRKRFTAANGSRVLPGDHATVRRMAVIDTVCGSRLKIDNGSRVEFSPPVGQERMKMKILEGRAFFRVQKSPKRFIVEGTARVEVKGTTFGICQSNAQTTVSVYHGEVDLKSGGRELHLHRGQSGRATATSSPVHVEVDPNKALKWARESIKFEDASVEDVLHWIAENSRYNIETSSAIQNDIRVNLEITDQDPAQIMDVIAVCCGLHWEEDGNWLVLAE